MENKGKIKILINKYSEKSKQYKKAIEDFNLYKRPQISYFNFYPNTRFYFPKKTNIIILFFFFLYPSIVNQELLIIIYLI